MANIASLATLKAWQSCKAVERGNAKASAQGLQMQRQEWGGHFGRAFKGGIWGGRGGAHSVDVLLAPLQVVRVPRRQHAHPLEKVEQPVVMRQRGLVSVVHDILALQTSREAS